MVVITCGHRNYTTAFFHNEMGLIHPYSWLAEVKPHGLIRSLKKFLSTLLGAGSLLCLFLTAAYVFCPQRGLNQASAVEQGRAIARRDARWAYKAVIKCCCFGSILSNLRLAKHIIEENAGEYIKKP